MKVNIRQGLNFQFNNQILSVVILVCLKLQQEKVTFFQIPSSVSSLKKLDYLCLSQNRIDTIPRELCDLKVVEIDLNDNNIAGVVESGALRLLHKKAYPATAVQASDDGHVTRLTRVLQSR